MVARRLRALAETEASTDPELVRAGSAGDDQALGELYRRHAPVAERVARSITANPDDAADAVAEAFARVFSALTSGRIRTLDFRSYLLAATRNAAIDQIRRTGRVGPSGDPAVLDRVDPGSGPSERLVAGEDSSLIAQAFRDLPERWQSVLWLTEVERVTPGEAAGRLGLSANNVSQLAVRARARLRERYLQALVRNHADPGCQPTVDRLGAYLAGSLTERRRAEVDDHLARCDGCRRRLAEVEDLGGSLKRSALLGLLLLPRPRSSWLSARAVRRASDPAGQALATGPPAAVVPAVVPSVVPAVLVPAVAVAAVVAVVATILTVIARPDGGTNKVVATAPLPPAVTAPPPTGPPVTAAPVTTPPVTAAPVPPPTAPPATTGPVARPAAGTNYPRSTVAQGIPTWVDVFASPDASEPAMTLQNPTPSDAPLIFLVLDQQGEWIQVLLPVRPNGSTGWVRLADVTLTQHTYSIVVELDAHVITVFDGQQVILNELIGVGKNTTPTPGGLYFTKELFRTVDDAGRPSSRGPYGPFVFGLSGFSEVLFNFAGGEGVIGIHGTNSVASLGRDASNGCVRMSNAGITWLAEILPLGVPVDVRP